MTETPKFCKDCKHAKAHGEDLQCTRAETKDAKFNFLVTGEEPPIAAQFYFCRVEREHGCGEEAQYFEPKEQASTHAQEVA